MNAADLIRNSADLRAKWAEATLTLLLEFVEDEQELYLFPPGGLPGLVFLRSEMVGHA